jgi:putative transcriptional regulator
MFALARRGLTMLRAKRAIEALIEDGRIFVNLPTVEDPQALAADLAHAGIAAAPAKTPDLVDVRGLRVKLRLTREQFAARYGLDIEAVRNWESGKRVPDTAARSYLLAISNAPDDVEQAYAPTPAI